jgi:plastocyanin
MHYGTRVVAFAALILVGACGGGDTAKQENQPAEAAEKQEERAEQPTATGKVIEIAMITDEKGNRFEPSEVHAEEGDLLRFTLKIGAHNVNFPQDKNPGKTGLPAASEILQLPGQTLDVPVNFEEGEYFFQCDPHAALGMVGKLIVHD